MNKADSLNRRGVGATGSRDLGCRDEGVTGKLDPEAIGSHDLGCRDEGVAGKLDPGATGSRDLGDTDEGASTANRLVQEQLVYVKIWECVEPFFSL